MQSNETSGTLAVMAGCALLACSPADASSGFVEASNASFPDEFSVQTKEVAVVDIDGDGDLDLLLAQENGPNWLLVNDGEGRFAKSGDVMDARSGDTEAVVASDFDRDGDVDVLFVNEDDRVDEFYRNDGGALASPDFDLPEAGTSNAVLSVDLNRDGWDDVLIGNAAGVAAWINDKGDRFSDASEQYILSGAEGI